MGRLFSSPPEPPPLPPVPKPPPIPVVSEEAGEEAQRRARGRGGFRKTILTGALEPEDKKKKTTLG